MVMAAPMPDVYEPNECQSVDIEYTNTEISYSAILSNKQFN
jgi:hypothetical protein